MKEHAREYYPTNDPRRVLAEGLEEVNRDLGIACVSFTLERSLCDLQNLTDTSVNQPNLPIFRLYHRLNGFCWKNREELEELGVLGIFRDLEYGMVMHGNLALEDVVRSDHSNEDLFTPKELAVSTLDM